MTYKMKPPSAEHVRAALGRVLGDEGCALFDRLCEDLGEPLSVQALLTLGARLEAEGGVAAVIGRGLVIRCETQLAVGGVA